MTLIKCPRCGHSVLSVASLCPSCNATLGLTFLGPEHGGELAECRECGHSVRSGTRICPNCGAAKPGKRPGVLRPVLGLSAILVLFVFVVDSWPKNRAPVPPVVTAEAPKSVTRPRATRPHVDSASVASAAAAHPASDSTSKDSARPEPPRSAAAPTPTAVTPPVAIATAGPSVDSTLPKAGAPSPAAAPAPAPPARDSAASGLTLKWTIDWVNVRQRPMDNAHVIRILRPGTRIEVKPRRYGWWLVFVGNDSLGYVAGSLISSRQPR
jgi:ribosomal protein L32